MAIHEWRKFQDRAEAGQRLAAELGRYARHADAVVLALPRGGVPVGYQIATALGLPLEVFVVRKIGFPGREAVAIGAIASGGVQLLNDDVIRAYRIPRAEIDRAMRQEEVELERRERQYRGARPFPDLHGKTAILVDDGLATGSTMRVAVEALRREGPAKIVVAVPVAARQTCDAFRDLADEIVCAITPEPFYAVGLWYDDFSQTTDEEVHDLLARARAA